MEPTRHIGKFMFSLFDQKKEPQQRVEEPGYTWDTHGMASHSSTRIRHRVAKVGVLVIPAPTAWVGLRSGLLAGYSILSVTPVNTYKWDIIRKRNKHAFQ